MASNAYLDGAWMAGPQVVDDLVWIADAVNQWKEAFRLYGEPWQQRLLWQPPVSMLLPD